MVFDGARTRAPRAIRSSRRAAFVVSSFGKTYHVTGWKVGYVAAPARADAPSSARCTSSTCSRSTRRCSTAWRATWPTRRTTWSCRRSTSASATCSAPGWRETRLRLLPSQGSYFQCVDYSAVSDSREGEFCRWLTTRDRRGGDSAVGVLRRRLRPADGAFLLRQAGRDAGPRPRAPGARSERVAASARAARGSAGSAPAGGAGSLLRPAVVAASRETSRSTSTRRRRARSRLDRRVLERQEQVDRAVGGLALSRQARAPSSTGRATRGRPGSRTRRRRRGGTSGSPASHRVQRRRPERLQLRHAAGTHRASGRAAESESQSGA